MLFQLAVEGRGRAFKRKARDRRELAYTVARLQRSKKLPNFAAFLNGEEHRAPPQQTEDEMEAVFDRWALAMRSVAAQQNAALTHLQF